MLDPFFKTKPAGEGTGLGLSLSHDVIVKQHAGAIDVETLSAAAKRRRPTARTLLSLSLPLERSGQWPCLDRLPLSAVSIDTCSKPRRIVTLRDA